MNLICYDELAARGYRGPKWRQEDTADAERPLRWREINDRTNGSLRISTK